MKPEDIRNRVLKVRLSRREMSRVKRVAEQNHQTIPDLVREALNESMSDCDDDPPIRLSKI